ncbi:hypothetical protein SteCoe_4433 [Stentor coeruleus]|uniref:Uncharacterized protein n=1 Tax=Stentor coeruleus TaxID=5963 RepID=A0A1R2CUX4_9CILI|nr:hypothetical protein SteCoe_4433 [Stentor coeruleus]
MDYISVSYSYKEQGNMFWKKPDIENAIKEYSKALLCLNHIFKENLVSSEKETMKLVKEIQIPCLLNLAACHLKAGEKYEKAIIHCNDVLNIEPDNTKALYRRACANIELGIYDKASKDLDSARHIDPDNKELRETQAKLRLLKTKGKKNNFSMSSWTIFGKSLLLSCKRKAMI